MPGVWTGTSCKGEGVKRWITKLVVFLLLGAVVNVAVAWGCALWSSMTQDSDLSKQRALTLLQEREFLPRPGDPYGGRTIEGIGLTVLELLFDPIAGQETSEINQREATWLMATLAGLPVRSLQAEVRLAASDYADPVYSVVLIGGIRIDNRVMKPAFTLENVLPVQPIWPGFAINTIFYAAILWLLTFGPFMARRYIRHKRGRCINCGYDLRGTFGGGGVCPECGVQRA